MNRVTYALVLANVVVFGLEAALGGAFLEPLVLWPIGAGFEPWQLVSSAFLHASFAHLATNMFGLWMFGRPVEGALGSHRFAALYGSSLLTASAAQLIVAALTGERVPALGASGALFGVLAAFAMLFPKRTIVLLFPPIPLPANLFVALYALLELFSGISGSQPGVAHFAHLGGLVGGVLVLRHWRNIDAGNTDRLAR